jgi:hypothetical protein
VLHLREGGTERELCEITAATQCNALLYGALQCCSLVAVCSLQVKHCSALLCAVPVVVYDSFRGPLREGESPCVSSRTGGGTGI